MFSPARLIFKICLYKAEYVRELFFSARQAVGRVGHV